MQAPKAATLEGSFKKVSGHVSSKYIWPALVSVRALHSPQGVITLIESDWRTRNTDSKGL